MGSLVTPISQLQSPPDQLQLGIPAEGPRVLPLRLDFSASGAYSLDYTNMQSRGFFSMCQCVFIDNQNSDVPLTVQCGVTGQQVVAKGRTQGYYPVLQPNPLQMQFFQQGGGAVALVYLLNFFVQGSVWATQ